MYLLSAVVDYTPSFKAIRNEWHIIELQDTHCDLSQSEPHQNKVH